MNTFLSILLSVVLSAQIDSTEIVIGDQTTLRLEATTNASEIVEFPRFHDQIINGLEIVKQGSIDSIAQGDNITYKQEYVITSFSDSLFFIEPLAFIVNGDTQRTTQSLSLNVIQPFQMDTTDAIFDIHPVMKPQIWWWGIIRWILLGVLLIGLCIGGYYLARWFNKRKQIAEEAPIDPELLRPCDEVALEKLDKIKAQKSWQEGHYKDYFTQLTDVIREYVGRRYEVRSTEKTSDETLAALKPILAADEQKELYTKLQSMLRLADLVKFAKWTPTPDESEIALLSAYSFVKQTAPTNNVQESPQEDTSATNNAEAQE